MTGDIQTKRVTVQVGEYAENRALIAKHELPAQVDSNGSIALDEPFTVGAGIRYLIFTGEADSQAWFSPAAEGLMIRYLHPPTNTPSTGLYSHQTLQGHDRATRLETLRGCLEIAHTSGECANATTHNPCPNRETADAIQALIDAEEAK